MLGAPRLGKILWGPQGGVQRLDEQPFRAGDPMQFLSLPSGDPPVQSGLAWRGFRALPSELRFAVQRTPFAGLHPRQGVEPADRLVPEQVAIRVFSTDDVHLCMF